MITPSLLAANDLPLDTVQLWIADLAVTPEKERFYSDLCSREEWDRAARYRFPHHQRRYLVGRGILRVLLGHYLRAAPGAILFAVNPYGKPGVTGIDFNVSHCGEYILYGFYRGGALGVDLERIRPIEEAPDIAERLGLDETGIDAGSFFAAWTRREAILKAAGTGFGALIGRTAEQPSEWIAQNVPIQAGYAAAVATRNVVRIESAWWRDE